jgi:cytochrome c
LRLDYLLLNKEIFVKIKTLGIIAAAFMAVGSGAAQAQDAAAGKAVFGAQCVACHSVDVANGAGPGLKGIIGRKAGSHAGFRFSRALKGTAYSWDEKSLDAYIANPQMAIPGTQMPYAGLADAKQRADLIAYLATLN